MPDQAIPGSRYGCTCKTTIRLQCPEHGLEDRLDLLDLRDAEPAEDNMDTLMLELNGSELALVIGALGSVRWPDGRPAWDEPPVQALLNKIADVGAAQFGLPTRADVAAQRGNA